MRIFLTGATGYIGSAVLDALVRAGHEVCGLVRNNGRAAAVAARGARPVTGSLADPASYRESAAGFDGYVHTAFEGSGRGPEVDRIALEALIEAARAGGRRSLLIYTSGIWVLGNTRTPAAEDAPLNPPAAAAWRPSHERLALDASNEDVRVVVVRPGIVYGGSRGIVGEMLKDAVNGLIRVVGDGRNHWPMIYDRDLGELYAQLVAHPEASGIYHANDEGDETVGDLVEAIGQHTPHRPEVRYIPVSEAVVKMGSYAEALTLDQLVRSPRARGLGWVPTIRSASRNVSRLFDEWRASRGADSRET